MVAAAAPITFLFTDIEGSTRLWETEPVRMADALARHDRLCREVVEQHDGRLIKMIGDGHSTPIESNRRPARTSSNSPAVAPHAALAALVSAPASQPAAPRGDPVPDLLAQTRRDVTAADPEHAARVDGIGICLDCDEIESE